MVALNFSQSIEQMKEDTAAIENTSDYVRREIERKKAIHNTDVTDLIRHEHSAYYQKVLDSSLAYDDLALHGERDLEKVRGSFTLPLTHLIGDGAARSFDHPRNECFPAANVTAVLLTGHDSIAGETCEGRSNRG